MGAGLGGIGADELDHLNLNIHRTKGPFHMPSNPLTTSSDPAARSLSERLQRLEQDLNRQRQRVNASTTLTVIIGLIALIAVGAYSYIGYREISWAVQPENVVSTG